MTNTKLNTKINNGYDSLGDVNPLEHGGLWIRKDEDYKAGYDFVTALVYDDTDNADEYIHVVSGFVDLEDDWIDCKAVSDYAGVWGKSDDIYKVQDVISYYGTAELTDYFTGVMLLTYDEAITELAEYGITEYNK